ncbi:hypothetical protein CANCADRAFT_58380 [Tortispora caseinolytica NRRL Y-17796]|uniref:Uncharacterized protein n=1 Tax=Tortispora caseinolytica NRRL Y-17796 TaxID=767744 RepID=A0A1E4TCG9_9ASCO|nr:hypothetical protein CANCADRAFT_58380 [Tortispora caseinolytica NRRL Y-17796]
MGNIYREAVYPVGKIFLMGSIVYTSVHWLRLKLLTDETEKNLNAVVDDLQHKAYDLKATKFDKPIKPSEQPSSTMSKWLWK